MTSKGYSNDIKVQCSSWVVAVIMGVCLSDPAKVGLSLSHSHLSLALSLSNTHTHQATHIYVGPRPRQHHAVGGKTESPVGSTEGAERELKTEMKEKEGRTGRRRQGGFGGVIANEGDR